MRIGEDTCGDTGSTRLRVLTGEASKLPALCVVMRHRQSEVREVGWRLKSAGKETLLWHMEEGELNTSGG